jgi:hypothetical protein
MNHGEFNALLESLEPADWQAIVDGQALLIIDDTRLQAGPADSPNAIIRSTGETPVNAFRQYCLSHAGDIIDDYYRSHPLTANGFRSQAIRLVEQYGAPAFLAVEGTLPDYTLFVDGGELLAESRDSPRHRYGAFCEILQDASANPKTTVLTWIHDGLAYARYLEMNVCRYSC